MGLFKGGGLVKLAWGQWGFTVHVQYMFMSYDDHASALWFLLELGLQCQLKDLNAKIKVLRKFLRWTLAWVLFLEVGVNTSFI